MSVAPPDPKPSHHAASPESVGLLRLAEDTDHRLALFGSVLVGVWLRTRIEALLAMEKVIEQAAPSAPNGRLAIFVVVEPHAITPSSAAREELARIRRANTIGVTALVYEGDGFGAALVRGITTSLNLLERGKTRTNIFADVGSATRWLQTTAPEYGGGEALEAAIRSLRMPSG